MLGGGDLHHDIGGVQVLVKDALHLDSDFHLVLTDLSVNWHDLEGEVDVLGDTVGHQLKASVWGNEGNRSFFIKFGQFHALVKFHVVNSDTLVAGNSLLFGLLFHQELVVHS